jgi:hypothetical protein
MIPHLKAAEVARLACIQLHRVLDIEQGKGAPATLAEVGEIFCTLRRAREKALTAAGY